MFFLDALGQLRQVSKLERVKIMNLFAHKYQALCFHFPQWGNDKDGPYRKPGKFDGDSAAAAMTQACGERKLIDPSRVVRGVGAWADDTGALIYHLGDKVLLGGKDMPPGHHDGYLYPARPAIPHPAETADKADGAYADLVEKLSTWQFKRGEVDVIVLLAQVGIQMIAGALDWKPHLWLTGGAGTGKSELQKLIAALHGGETGLVQSADSTAAGISGQLAGSSLPVALDELEPSDSQQKEKAIVELARIASSGGRKLRGASDQSSWSAALRSAFLFSSVIIPSVLKSQDYQRIVIVDLMRFPPGTVHSQIDPRGWKKRGAVIKRAIIDRWPTWADRLALWKAALETVGIHGRNANNWGTILAMACMLRQAALPSADELAGWAAKVRDHVADDLLEIASDDKEALSKLLGFTFEPMANRRLYTMAQVIQAAAKSPDAPRGLFGGDDVVEMDDIVRTERAKKAGDVLALFGMRMFTHGDGDYLFIGNSPDTDMRKVFPTGQWMGGAWKQSFERVPGARKAGLKTIAGQTMRGVEVPLLAMPGIMAFPANRSAPRPASVHQIARDLPPDAEDF